MDPSGRPSRVRHLLVWLDSAGSTPAAVGTRQTRLLTRRDVWILYTGHGFTQLSSGLLYLAVPLLALRLTPSPSLLAATGAAYAAAAIIVSPLAGSVADSVSRRALLVSSGLARSGLAGCLPLLLLTRPGPATAGGLVLGSFLLGAATAFYQSTVHTVPPRLARGRKLQHLNATMFVLTNAAIVVGPALAGVLWSRAGIAGTFAIAAAIGLPGAVAFTLLRLPSQHVPTSGRALLHRTRDGVVYTWRSPVLRSLLILWSVIFIGSGSLVELLVYRLNTELRIPAGAAGLVVAGAASGAAIGPLLLRVFATRSHERSDGVGDLRLVMAAGPVIGALYLAMLALSAPLPLAMLGAVVQGVIAAGVVRSITLAQRVTPNDILGRVTSVALLVEQAAVMLGLGLMGWLTAAAGTRLAFGVFGTSLLVGGGAAALGVSQTLSPARRRRLHRPTNQG